MKLPESGRLFPPLFPGNFPLSEYGSSAEIELTLFTLSNGERWFWVKKTTANRGSRATGMTWPFDFSSSFSKNESQQML